MMNHILILSVLASVSAGSIASLDHSSTFLTRAPAYDSAIIQSDRLGGNFAYSVSEAHAFTAHTPIVEQRPVAVSYNHGAATTTVNAAAPAFYAASPNQYYNGGFNNYYPGNYFAPSYYNGYY